jgi:hypothetical protein
MNDLLNGLQNNSQHDGQRLVVSTHRTRFMLLIGISLCMLFAFVLGAYHGILPASAHSASASPASTSSVGYPIKVFFSQSPGSFNNFSAVYPVDRMSPSLAVGTFSIQLLIAGPTLTEQQAGYFSELNTMFSGPSNCAALPVGGPDFTLTLDMRGPKPEVGTATVKFCRLTSSGGIGTDARVTAEIDATLEQFPRIHNVVILTYDGHCFGDLSGKDLCLK